MLPPYNHEIAVPNWKPNCQFVISALFTYPDLPKEDYQRIAPYTLYTGNAVRNELKLTGGKHLNKVKPGVRPEEYGYKIWYRPEEPNAEEVSIKLEPGTVLTIGTILSLRFRTLLSSFNSHGWQTDAAQNVFNNTMPTHLPIHQIKQNDRSYPFLATPTFTVFQFEYSQAQDQFGNFAMAWQRIADARDDIFLKGERKGQLHLMSALITNPGEPAETTQQ